MMELKLGFTLYAYIRNGDNIKRIRWVDFTNRRYCEFDNGSNDRIIGLELGDELVVRDEPIKENYE